MDYCRTGSTGSGYSAGRLEATAAMSPFSFTAHGCVEVLVERSGKGPGVAGYLGDNGHPYTDAVLRQYVSVLIMAQDSPRLEGVRDFQ